MRVGIQGVGVASQLKPLRPLICYLQSAIRAALHSGHAVNGIPTRRPCSNTLPVMRSR